jgi:hypothetical protein
MKTAREAGEKQQRVVGHGDGGALFSARQQCEPDEEPDRKDREAEERDFLLYARPRQ